MRSSAALAVGLLVIAAAACDGDDAAAPTTSAVATATTTAVTATTTAATPSSTVADASSTVPTEATVPPATGLDPSVPEVLGPLGSNQVEIDTDEGSVQIGSGTIPPSAAAVPVPDDLEVELATEASGSAGYSGTSSRTVAELADFYAASLPAAGFDVTEDRTAGSARFIAFGRDDGVGQVAISPAPGGGGSTVVVAYGPPI